MQKNRHREAIVIGVAFCLLGLLAAFRDRAEDTAKDGYLLRDDYDGYAYQEELEANVDGHKETVTVRVEPQVYTEAQAEVFFDEAEEELSVIIGGNGSADTADSERAIRSKTAPVTIERDLDLPEKIGDLPVTAEYYTGNSQILSYDGKIGPEAKAEGSPIELEAVLHCGEYSRSLFYSLTVYPKAEEELSFQAKVDEAVAEANRVGSTSENEDADAPGEDSADKDREGPENRGTEKHAEDPENRHGEEPLEERDTKKWYLPQTIDGRKVTWHRIGDRTGASIGAIGILIAVGYLAALKKRDEEVIRLRNESMLRDYPHIVSKLVLLLGAGLSMRRAFRVMAEDYRNSLKGGGKKRWGFEEVCRVCDDLEAGVMEAEAYHRLGLRCDLPVYRTFSVLLGQNLKRGSRELMTMLEREAVSAFEDRKKEARILGEKASAKLLLPMMLMLLIVFTIVMVPAFLSFG